MLAYCGVDAAVLVTVVETAKLVPKTSAFVRVTLPVRPLNEATPVAALIGICTNAPLFTASARAGPDARLRGQIASPLATVTAVEDGQVQPAMEVCTGIRIEDVPAFWAPPPITIETKRNPIMKIVNCLLVIDFLDSLNSCSVQQTRTVLERTTGNKGSAVERHRESILPRISQVVISKARQMC